MKVCCNQHGIAEAVKAVQSGQIIIFPTDTVYGIGCNPYNSNAIKKIYEIKNRMFEKAFPILGYSQDELGKIAVFDKKSTKIVNKFWPGKVTLVLELKDKEIKKTMKIQKKIAVRVPDNQCVLKILAKCKLLVGSSANISGTGPFTNPKLCQENITGYDIFVDDGLIKSKGESTIVEVDNSEVIFHRVGAVSEEEIMSIF